MQFPDSSQGYNRYTYVNNNPLSLSDPTGYTSEANRREEGLVAAILVTWACAGTCTAEGTAFLGGAADGYISSGGTWSGTAMGGTEAMAFAQVGGAYGDDPQGTQLFERSVSEGLLGGAFALAGGGRFSDGFLGAFASSELSGEIGNIGGDRSDSAYYSPLNESARVAVSAIVGGSVSRLTGGSFGDGAVAAAFQRLFNDDHQRKTVTDKIPAKLVVETSKTVNNGPYSTFAYRLQNAKGQALTGDGYGVQEHLFSDPAATQHMATAINSEATFVPAQKGEFGDNVGYLDFESDNTSYRRYQTFTVSYNGQDYNLTTELEHITTVVTQEYYINTVSVVKP